MRRDVNKPPSSFRRRPRPFRHEVGGGFHGISWVPRGAPNVFGGLGKSALTIVRPPEDQRSGVAKQDVAEPPIPGPWKRDQGWHSFKGKGRSLNLGRPFLRKPVPVLLNVIPQLQYLPPSELVWKHRSEATHQSVETFGYHSSSSGDCVDIYLTAGPNRDGRCNMWSAEGGTCKLYRVTWDLTRMAAVSVDRIYAGWDGHSASADDQLEGNVFKNPAVSPDGDMLAFRVLPVGEQDWRLGIKPLDGSDWVAWFNNARTGVTHFPTFLGAADRMLYHVEDENDVGEYSRAKGTLYAADLKYSSPHSSDPGAYVQVRAPLAGSDAGSHFRGDPFAVGDVAVDHSWDAPNAATYRIVGHGARLRDGTRWETWDERRDCNLARIVDDDTVYGTMTSMGNWACAMPRVMTLDRTRVGPDGDYVSNIEEFDNAIRYPMWPEDRFDQTRDMLYGCHHPAWNPDGTEVLCSAMQYPTATHALDFGETDRGGGWMNMLFSFTRWDVAVSNPWRTNGLLFDAPNVEVLAAVLGDIFEPASGRELTGTKCYSYQYKYAEWCLRDDLILTTIFCNIADKSMSPQSIPTSRVVLVQRTSETRIGTATHWDISREVEKMYEGSGEDSLGSFSAVYGTCTPTQDVSVGRVLTTPPRPRDVPTMRDFATATPQVPSGLQTPGRPGRFVGGGWPAPGRDRVSPHFNSFDFVRQ